MLKTARSLGVCFAVTVSVGCHHTPAEVANSHPTGVDGGVPVAPLPSVAMPVPTTPVSAPDRAIATFRGTGLRRVLNFIAAGVPAGVAIGQIAPSFTPGIGEHGIDVDPDAVFAAAMMVPEATAEHGSLALVIAWPLRAGMQIAQDAAAHRGYSEVTPGVYQPVNSDAGAGSPTPCWVARRAPVGWTLLCGPRESLRAAAPYLVWASSSPPPAGTVLDVTARPQPARQILGMQLASLEAQNPRVHPTDAGVPREVLLAEYDEAHRGLENTRQIADDLGAFHAVLVADENSYHLHAEADFAHGSGPATRAILGSTVGHHAATDLLEGLPAGTSAYVAMGFDMHALGPLLVPNGADPRIAQVLGPEMAHFQEGVRNVTDFRSGGDRAMGFASEDGGTTFQITRMTDAAAALTNIRNLAAAVPRSPRPSGANPADYLSLMPTPGLPPGSLRMRLGPDPARLPPNAPAEERRILSRTVLFVPQGDKLTMIEGADPVAGFRGMSQGDRLRVTAPADQVLSMHLTPAGLGSLIGMPTSPDAPLSNEAIVGTLSATRAGDDGGHFSAQIDAPIAAVNQVRDLYLRVQQSQAQAELQQRQAMAAAQHAQQGSHGPRGLGGLVAPAPSSPDELPEPNFQLHTPH